MLRMIWVGGGVGSLVLAAIGAVLPVLPTTPFIILAAACFARGSPRCHRWIRSHPRFGGAVRDWEEHRAIARHAKVAATAAIALVGGASVLFLGRPEAQLALAGILALVLLFLWTRPEPPRAPRS